MGVALGRTTPVPPRNCYVTLGDILRKKSTGQDSVGRWFISTDRRVHGTMVSLCMNLGRARACLEQAHRPQGGPAFLE